MVNPSFGGEELSWFDGSKKIILWERGYDTKHQATLFSESPTEKARLQVLSGEIIVVFLKKQSEHNLNNFSKKYELRLKNKVNIGNSTYLFEVLKKNKSSLRIANNIYHTEKVKASYPNWIYIGHEK